MQRNRVRGCVPGLSRLRMVFGEGYSFSPRSLMKFNASTVQQSSIGFVGMEGDAMLCRIPLQAVGMAEQKNSNLMQES